MISLAENFSSSGIMWYFCISEFKSSSGGGVFFSPLKAFSDTQAGQGMPAFRKAPAIAQCLGRLVQRMSFPACRSQGIAQILTHRTAEWDSRGAQPACTGTTAHTSSRRPSSPRRWTSSHWRRFQCRHFHSWTSWWRSSSHKGTPTRTRSGNRNSYRRCFSSRHK